jgi:hypothetical protein
VNALVRIEPRALADAEHLAMELSRKASEAFAAHKMHGRRSLAEARRCGQLLLEIKLLVPHGKFGAWVENHCGCTHRMADYLMRLAASYPTEAKFETVSDLTLHAALKKAAGEEDERKPSPPGDPRQESVFSEEQAPVPPDAASRLLARGVPITGETDRVRKLKALFRRLARDRPWEGDYRDVLELDDETLDLIVEVSPPMIDWLAMLKIAAKAMGETRQSSGELATRPSLSLVRPA